jgi:hypothetical protein
VLVIDRVELVVLDQPHQVRELQRDRAAGLERGLQPRVKSLMSGTWA